MKYVKRVSMVVLIDEKTNSEEPNLFKDSESLRKEWDPKCGLLEKLTVEDIDMETTGDA